MTFRTYTKKEIAYKLNCSVRTVEEDVKYLKLTPAQDARGTNLYSGRDFDLISQMREHCKNKANTRNNFVAKTPVDILDIEPKVTKLTKVENKDLAIIKYKESITFGLKQDPLFDLEILQRISDNHWLLPANRLAPLFNISPKYLNSKTRYEYCGFIANKEAYSSGRVLWKVTANNS